MVINKIIPALELALNSMDKKFCKLSTLDYNEIRDNNSFRNQLMEGKYLERPFAYEFYHQLRSLIKSGDVELGNFLIQAEVDKRYQHCFRKVMIQDFIIHKPNIPNPSANLAVIEFKLASRNITDIGYDIEKLIAFKHNSSLKYRNGIEVLIGHKYTLKDKFNRLDNLDLEYSSEICVFGFNVDTWESEKKNLIYLIKTPHFL